MVFLEDSVFLNLVNGEREHENYGMTHTLKYELVNRQLGDLLVEKIKSNSLKKIDEILSDSKFIKLK